MPTSAMRWYSSTVKSRRASSTVMSYPSISIQGVADARVNVLDSILPSPAVRECRHHVLREPSELVRELTHVQALGPMDHEVLEARVLGLDRLDALDDMGRRPAEPGLLLDAVGQRRRARRGARRAPRPSLLVGVAHEPERREPLVPLVVRRLDPALRLFRRVCQIEPRAPDHVLAELLLLAVLRARVPVGVDDVVEDLLAVQ